MFNSSLDLGLPHTEMLYSSCGAVKNYDQALVKILENISYDGMINMILEQTPCQDAVERLSPECRNAKAAAETQRDNDSDELEFSDLNYGNRITEIDRVCKETINEALKRFTKEIIDREFLMDSKYAGFTQENIDEIREILN